MYHRGTCFFLQVLMLNARNCYDIFYLPPLPLSRLLLPFIPLPPFAPPGFVGGYQLAFDAASRKLTKSNFAFGYRAADFQVHTAVNDGSEFVGSLYQKLSGNLETGKLIDGDR